MVVRVRAFTVIERVLIGALVLVALVVLVVLLIWHLQWRKVLRVIAEHPPRADVAALEKTLPEPPGLSATEDAAVTSEAMAWRMRTKIKSINPQEPWLMGTPGAFPSAEMIAQLDANRAPLQDLRDLLGRGYHTSHRKHIEPGQPWSWDDQYFLYSVLYPAAQSWHAWARRDQDPGPDLDALDALVAARVFPDDSNDLAWEESIADSRDNAYLVSVALSRVSADRIQVWQSEPDQAASRLLVYLDQLRCIGRPSGTSRQVAHLPQIDPIREPQGILPSWNYWFSQPDDLEKDMVLINHWQDALLVRDSWSVADAKREARLLKNHRWPFLHAFRHRLAVLATQVLAQRDAASNVPATPVGLDFSAGTDRMLLHYRKLSERSFAIVADPQQTPFIAACLADDPPKPPELSATAGSSLNPIAVVVALP